MKTTSFYWTFAVLAGVVLICILVGKFSSGNNTESNVIPGETAIDPTIAAVAAPALAQVPSTTSALHSPKVNNNIHPEFQERFSAMQQRRPNTQFDAKAVEAAIKRENLWATATQPAKTLTLKPEELKDGRQFIHFDSLKIETLMPGDNLKIAIAEFKQDYEVVIDRIEQHDYENISWHGHIDAGDGQNYSVSFTRGEKLTVAGIDTPEGNYVLQAHGNDGWIASSGLLFKVDPDVSDVIYPPEEQPL
ncbi:MAG: hypothetical protein V4660_15160 [Pseudomonadota bacterium]